MKTLLMRNLKLSRFSLITYLVVVVAALYYQLGGIEFQNMEIIAPFASIILFVIIVMDTGHAFRIQRKLGGDYVHYFVDSLPVSKLQQLNAHYATIIILTLAGVIAITTADYAHVSVNLGALGMEAPVLYAVTNLMTVALVFTTTTEKRMRRINQVTMFFTFFIIVPMGIFVATVLGYKFMTGYYGIISNYDVIVSTSYVSMSVIAFIARYFYEYRKISKTRGVS